MSCNIRQFICKMSAIRKKKKSLKYNIKNLAIKNLYLTMIKQCIKNMSLREEVLFVRETRFVMWSSNSADMSRISHAQLIPVPSSARMGAQRCRNI